MIRFFMPMMAAAFSLALLANAAPAAAQSGSGELRGTRYCELLPAYPADDNQIRLDVYNTLGYNDCPQDWWNHLNTHQLAKENNALTVVKNGPRYWVMDEIYAGAASKDGEVKTFDEQQLQWRATVLQPIANLAKDTAYTQSTVNRTTTYVYKARRSVYQLTDDKGNTYLMQTYSQQVNPNLTMADLDNLGTVLKLPQGWTYTVWVPLEDLKLTADGRATVVQDDLKNTYQLKK